MLIAFEISTWFSFFFSGIIKRSVWVVVLCCTITCLLYNVITITLMYFSYDIALSIEMQQNNELTFPAVTICNMSPMKAVATTTNAEDNTTKNRKRRCKHRIFHILTVKSIPDKLRPNFCCYLYILFIMCKLGLVCILFVFIGNRNIGIFCWFNLLISGSLMTQKILASYLDVVLKLKVISVSSRSATFYRRGLNKSDCAVAIDYLDE